MVLYDVDVARPVRPALLCDPECERAYTAERPGVTTWGRRSIVSWALLAMAQLLIIEDVASELERLAEKGFATDARMPSNYKNARGGSG